MATTKRSKIKYTMEIDINCIKALEKKAFSLKSSEKILLAQCFYHEISKASGIETGPFPDLSIVIFNHS